MPMNPLVSVCIPAYNKQELLNRLLVSLESQNYRPLEIVVVDDNSPRPLKIDGISSNSDFSLVLVRNQSSLGPYWNMARSIELATGKYVYQIDHDDYLTDSSFIESAVNLMESNRNVNLVIANSKIEFTDSTMFKTSTDQNYRLANGLSFLRNHLFRDVHPARSGYIMNRDTLVLCSYTKVFYHLDDFQNTTIYPDESFSLPSILCSYGDVYVSDKVISVRGNPHDSFSKSDIWQATSNLSVLLQHIRLLTFLFKQRRLWSAVIIFRICIFGDKYAARIIPRNLNHLNGLPINIIGKLLVITNCLIHLPYWITLKAFYSLRYRVFRR